MNAAALPVFAPERAGPSPAPIPGAPAGAPAGRRAWPARGLRVRVPRRFAPGFTLLELLIAIAIFSVVATLAQGGLQAVLRAHERTEEAVDRIGLLRHTWVLLDQDMAAMAPRGIRDANGLARPWFVLAPGRIEFTRRRPLDDLPQRIEYRVVDDRLMRFEWPAGELTPGAEPLSGIVLEEVEAAELRVLVEGQWVTDWPLAGSTVNKEVLPEAVELRLSWQGHVLRWLFAVTA